MFEVENDHKGRSMTLPGALDFPAITESFEETSEG